MGFTIAVIAGLLVSFWGVSIINRERPVEAGELVKMLGAALAVLAIAVFVLSFLMIGSAETDWVNILPVAGGAFVGLLIGAGLGGIVLRTMGGNGKRA